MAVWHIKSTGTRSSLTASTADDWTDENCFPLEGGTYDFQNCFNATGPSDEIILDDETHLHTGIINIGNGTGETVNLTIKSRSGNAANCIISSNYASNAMFAHNTTSYAHVITYENITFTRTATFEAATGSIVSLSGTTSNCTFTGCVFSGITVSSAVSNTNGMLIQTTAMAAGTRDITFNDCQFNNLSLTANERPGIVAAIVDNAVYVNDCIVNTVTLASTSGEVIGLFNEQSGGMTVDGLTVTGLTLIGDGTNAVNGGVMFQPVAGDTITASNVHVDGVAITGSEGGCSAPVIHVRKLGHLSNSSVANAVNDVAGNSVGCLMLVGGTNTTPSTVTDCVSHNNRGFYGCGCYNTNSGTVIAKRVKSYDQDGGASGIGYSGEDFQGLDFYSGGSGDATWIGCEGYGATVQSAAAASSFYGINNTTAPRTDRAKVITIQNCTFADPVTTTMPVGKFSNTNATTQSLTLVIDNTIVSSDATNDIVLADGTASTPLDITLTNCNYGTIETTEHTVGTLTETNKVSGDPLFVSSTDHALQSSSPCIGTGYKYWLNVPNPIGVNGEPVSDFDIDIGSRPTTYGPFHPVNL